MLVSFNAMGSQTINSHIVGGRRPRRPAPPRGCRKPSPVGEGFLYHMCKHGTPKHQPAKRHKIPSEKFSEGDSCLETSFFNLIFKN